MYEESLIDEMICRNCKSCINQYGKWVCSQKPNGKISLNKDGSKKSDDYELIENLENSCSLFDKADKPVAKLRLNEREDGIIWDNELVIKKKVFPMDTHNGNFFYGLLLPKISDNIDKSGKILGKKQKLVPCLICSDKKYYEVTERFKEDWVIDFDLPSYLPPRWDLDMIKNYLDGESKQVEGKILLDKIKTIYERYLSIRNKTWYKVHSLWDIGTYLYMIFEAYPFVELRGIAGSGKSKSMTISSFISFNGGQVMVNPSESTLFRETDEVRGSKYFDEAEKLWIFNKSTKQYEGDVRTELINASYTKDAKVPRQEKLGNKFYTKWYSPYSPTQLSSINGLFGATETRAITRITTKSGNEDARGETEPAETRNSIIWAEIRDECYRFSLENWKAIKKIYDNFPKDCGLKRRELQIWKPILSLAKFINQEDYVELLKFAIELSNRRLDDLVPESSFDYLCLSALKKAIEKSDSQEVYVNMIKLFYLELVKNQEGVHDIYLNRNISSHLDKLGFKEFRKRSNKASYFEVTQQIFDEIVIPICPDLAFTSPPSPPSTQNRENRENNSVDGMVMDVDKNNKKVVMVAINGDDVDVQEFEESQDKPLVTVERVE